MSYGVYSHPTTLKMFPATKQKLNHAIIGEDQGAFGIAQLNHLSIALLHQAYKVFVQLSTRLAAFQSGSNRQRQSLLLHPPL